ncbi:MAG TPA: hypothetical protein VF070_20690 [Streptosporangiaceae bacterium]
MSEYQYYEFLTLDRPLTADELDEVRALSTRAEITSTSFTNEYHWGDFRGSPAELMRRYYDAHLYLANWGTHRIMLRLPRAVLAPEVAGQYCVDDQVTVSIAGEHVIIDMVSEDEPDDWEDGATHSLAAIAGVRAELAAGDMRALYLAWLAGWGMNELDEDEDEDEYEDEDEPLEPAVPAGLGSLTGPQRALADFLRLDADLLYSAASVSAPLTTARDDPGALATCIAGLTAGEKDRLLLLTAQGEGARVRLELLHRLHGTPEGDHGARSPRTLTQLLNAAAERRQDREERAAAACAAEEAYRERERALAREERLDALARDPEKAWADVSSRIKTRVPSEYDMAVSVLTDLRELARREGQDAEFDRRFSLLRQEHLRKPTLMERFDRSGLTRSPAH